MAITAQTSDLRRLPLAAIYAEEQQLSARAASFFNDCAEFGDMRDDLTPDELRECRGLVAHIDRLRDHMGRRMARAA